MAFGKKQLNNPTPSRVANIIDITSAVCGALITWLITVSFIPHIVSDVVSSVLGLVVTILQIIKPFFGVATSASNVPIGEVTTMDEPKKD